MLIKGTGIKKRTKTCMGDSYRLEYESKFNCPCINEEYHEKQHCSHRFREKKDNHAKYVYTVRERERKRYINTYINTHTDAYMQIQTHIYREE